MIRAASIHQRQLLLFPYSSLFFFLAHLGHLGLEISQSSNLQNVQTISGIHLYRKVINADERRHHKRTPIST
jgi:hypothetical protein